MKCSKLHLFSAPDTAGIAVPACLNSPFEYTPHPLAKLAAEQVKRYVAQHPQWSEELERGKMLGVLVVTDSEGTLGFLAAYSGILAGSNQHPYFVPPIFDMLKPNGEFKAGEAQISAINAQISQLQASSTLAKAKRELLLTEEQKTAAIASFKQLMSEAKAKREQRRTQGALSPQEQQALIAESQFQKAELKRIRTRHDHAIEEKKTNVENFCREIDTLKAQRKHMSEALQRRIFSWFVVRNARGEQSDLAEVFAAYYRANPSLQASAVPPSGAGECCAPKLLQYAFTHQLKPLCIAEFWWGKSPAKEVRHHGHYYGACLNKCRPILWFMLQGLQMEPRHQHHHISLTSDMVIYSDPWFVAANKPAGMLTVPGRLHDHSLQTQLSQAMGTTLKAVHRLDMATSGIVVLAKTDKALTALQAEFANRNIQKRYIALLDGMVNGKSGVIDLSLRPDINDRPRQMVDQEHGKRAITRYEVLAHTPDHRTRVAFYPHTGRTHQLRVHASHHLGLKCPIVGDTLYGHASTRLMLHAQSITFTHPFTHKKITLSTDCPF